MSDDEFTKHEIFALLLKWKAYAEEGDAIISEMRAALEILMVEVDASGNALATDYGWPKAVEAARAALVKSQTRH
jgi:hypothetical protein